MLLYFIRNGYGKEQLYNLKIIDLLVVFLKYTSSMNGYMLHFLSLVEWVDFFQDKLYFVAQVQKSPCSLKFLVILLPQLPDIFLNVSHFIYKYRLCDRIFAFDVDMHIISTNTSSFFIQQIYLSAYYVVDTVPSILKKYIEGVYCLSYFNQLQSIKEKVLFELTILVADQPMFGCLYVVGALCSSPCRK